MNFTISEVAKKSNVTVETIRYYEKRGLISEPDRSPSHYRMFSHDAIEDIRFIKQAQKLGFTLKEIKELLSISKQEEYYPTEEMYKFATAKVHEIEKEIEQLIHFKSFLEQVTTKQNCEMPLPKNKCPIINSLNKGELNNE